MLNTLPFSCSWAIRLVVCIAAAAAIVPIAISCAVAGQGRNSDELVVYSGRSETLVGPVVSMFEEATGIAVSVKYGSTSEIAATLIEEGRGTSADVFFAQDPAGLGAVAAEGVLAPLDADILSRVPGWAQSDDGLWVGISGRARTVVYNTDAVDPAEIPQTIEGFGEPIWKGRIGWAPTNGSFQAMVTAMRVIWGDDRTRSWLASVQSNDPRLFPSNTPIVAAVIAGEVEIGLVNHYYLHRFLAEEGVDISARNHHLTGGGPGSMVLVAGAGVVEGAKNADNAAAFLKFMLSDVAQQYFADHTYEYPLIDGITLGRLVTPPGDLAIPDVDMADLADLAGTQAMLRELGITP